MKRLLSSLLFGVIFIAAGIGLLALTGSSEKRCTVAAEGVVIGYEAEQHSDSKGSSTSYYPVIQYKYDNRVYEERSNVGGGRKDYADGTTLQIMINPENPYEFVIPGSSKPFTIASWAMIVIGAFVIIGGPLGLVKGGSGRSTTAGPGIAGIYYIIKELKDRKKNNSEQG